MNCPVVPAGYTNLIDLVHHSATAVTRDRPTDKRAGQNFAKPLRGGSAEPVALGKN
jgi:hypothetical protein